MTRISSIALLALFACNGGSSDIGTVPVTPGPTETEPKETNKPATGIDVSEVAIYQGVEIQLYDSEGEVPEIQAPLIRNRDSMVRVFVNPHDDFEPRKIRVDLEVEDNNSLEVFEIRERVDGRSFRGQLDTTFNFDVPAELMKANTELRVRIYEVNNNEEWGGTEGNTSWDSGKLDPVKSDTLNIVLIPVQYNADGSGRVPDTSQVQLDSYENTMEAMYPVEDVNLTVGPTLSWNSTISSNGNGWSSLLNEISDLRSAANVDDNTYYYGIFDPDDSFFDFCNFGCVLGLSNFGYNPNADWSKSSIGLGYVGLNNMAANTFVHEVGHAHGRSHADCGGASGIDPSYPYGPDAIIGSWGYDTRRGVLYEPDQNHDMMAYCDPMWISDYQYYSLYLRIVDVGNVSRSAKIPRQTIHIEMDGTASLDKVRDMVPDLGGEPVDVELLGIDGQVIARVDGEFVKYSHIYGGTVAIDSIDYPGVVGVRVPTLEKLH